jgi:ribosomal protein S12 methylthiotransferase
MAASDHTIHFVSLGCAKNRVDAEVMLGVAQRAGFSHVSDPAAARIILVNTCGFIDAAKRESIEVILEMAAYKRTGACRQLVVAGCLSQRHPAELAETLPEVDHFLGSSDMLRLAEVLRGGSARILVGDPAAWIMGAADPRALTTHTGSAYVKLAEGCSRECSFCVIPALRGRQRSRPLDDLIAEVERLAAAGVVEVNLLSQDSVAYGRDLRDGTRLARVVHRVAEVPGIHWVRIHYLYPERLDADLVALWAEHPRVLPYVDVPLQHVADTMLRRMRRGYDGGRARALVERLRREVPNVVLRSAFIVGHPGESRAEYEELREFVRHAEFDHVGVFCYSDEDGTHSQRLKGKVAARIAESRARRLMELQRGIAARKNAGRIGQELEVLVEGSSEEHEWVLQGRHAGQAPEIDGVVYLSGAETRPGTLCRVRITDASDYDLVGEVISDAGRRHLTTTG